VQGDNAFTRACWRSIAEKINPWLEDLFPPCSALFSSLFLCLIACERGSSTGRIGAVGRADSGCVALGAGRLELLNLDYGRLGRNFREGYHFSKGTRSGSRMRRQLGALGDGTRYSGRGRPQDLVYHRGRAVCSVDC
jgi:hypothetical protein